MQHTYVLYTVKEGVFYVGIGDEKRLKRTRIIPRTRANRGPSEKYKEIERRQADGQEILLEVAFSSEHRTEVEQCERGLIACYGTALTNFIYRDTERASSWLPIGMKHQKFPLPDCPECMRLAQECFNAQRRIPFYAYDYGRVTTPEERQAREDLGSKQIAYYHHKQTHPQIIPA